MAFSLRSKRNQRMPWQYNWNSNTGILVVNLLILQNPISNLILSLSVICIGVYLFKKKTIFIQVMLACTSSCTSGNYWACFAFLGVTELTMNTGSHACLQWQWSGSEILDINKRMHFLSFLQGFRKSKEETQCSASWKIKIAEIFGRVEINYRSRLLFQLPQINVKENAYFTWEGCEEALL